MKSLRLGERNLFFIIIDISEMNVSGYMDGLNRIKKALFLFQKVDLKFKHLKCNVYYSLFDITGITWTKWIDSQRENRRKF